MTIKDVANGAGGDRKAQLEQLALDFSEAPEAILSSQADDQRLQLDQHLHHDLDPFLEEITINFRFMPYCLKIKRYPTDSGCLKIGVTLAIAIIAAVCHRFAGAAGPDSVLGTGAACAPCRKC